jgi:hypothetical protein
MAEFSNEAHSNQKYAFALKSGMSVVSAAGGLGPAMVQFASQVCSCTLVHCLHNL